MTIHEYCLKWPFPFTLIPCLRNLKTIGKTAFAYLTWLATFFLLISNAHAGTYCEAFNNNQFNAKYFNLFTVGTGPSASVISNRLEMTIPSNSSGNSFFAAFGLRRNLSGDFDVQVDFNLLTWPAASGIRAGIDTDLPSSVHRTSFGPTEGGAREVYYIWINGNMTQITTTDTSGKLRMKRTGNKIEGFYWQNNAWQSIAAYSDPTYGKDLGVNISTNSGSPPHFSGQTVKVAFDNFRITNKNILGGTPFLSLLMD